MKEFIGIEPSNRVAHLYKATFRYWYPAGHCKDTPVYFGNPGSHPYILSHDRAARMAYWKRRKACSSGPMTSPAVLASHLLWGPHETLEENVAAYCLKYGLKRPAQAK